MMSMQFEEQVMNASVALKVEPFSRQIDPFKLFESAGHREALARLKIMVERRGLGLLSGEVGSGKSTLIRRLFSELDRLRYQVIYISIASLKPREFYGELLQANGEIPPFSLAKCRLQWAECLRLRHGQDEKCLVIVIDEAQDMSEAMIQELRFVVNQQMDSCSDFPLILIGQPELRRITRLKKYDAVAQRIPLQYHLTGFTLEETAAYIRHQMKNAGLDAPLFTDRAIHLIYGYSQGIPRLINHICTQVLFAARQKNQEIIEDQDISRIISDSERQRGDF